MQVSRDELMEHGFDPKMKLVIGVVDPFEFSHFIQRAQNNKALESCFYATTVKGDTRNGVRETCERILQMQRFHYQRVPPENSHPRMLDFGMHGWVFVFVSLE